MSVVFDPFTGQIIDTGSSGGSPTIGGPVLGADPNAILVTDGATNLADIQLADGQVLIGKTGDAPLAATITGTPNQVDVTNGPNSITLSAPQDIATTSSPTFANLNLTPTAIIDVTTTGLLEIGVTNANVINIGNAGADVNIYGDTIYQNVTNLNVTDKNITVNNGGSAYTSFNSGIHVYDGGVADKGYLEVTPDMLGWDMKAPYADGVIVFEPGSAGFTINQGSHDPVTIATPANGLAILNQELSIALADSTTTGALSSTDWNTFNNKQSAFAFKVQAYDPVNTTLPTVDPTIIDGYTVLNGDKVLFSNLTNPLENNKIYSASISAGTITWTEDTSFVPTVNDYVLVENGDAFAVQAGVFNGTSFDFNRVVRYFNGVDYFEQSAIYAASLANNSTNTVFTINVTNSENMVVDYSILRGTNKTTGTLYITTDGITAQVSDVGVNLYSPVGVSFIADITGGQITLSCNTDNSGDNGELKYNIRRWSDAPGGPGGLPSYSGSGGSSTITIEEVSSVNPTVPFNNINTIQFDNDTGFNVTQPSPGTVKVSLGSTFKTWSIDNGAGPAQPSLVAVGEDTVEFVAGTNIEFVTDNTLGSKTFTINSTGSGPSTQVVTLSNNTTNGNVTGFIVDPLTADSFSADIVIKRNIPSGISPTTGGLGGLDPLKSIELNDGSVIFYKQNGFYSGNPPVKLNSDGTLNASFAANMILNGGFDQQITQIIDVTEDPLNQVLAVFGYFAFYQGLSRNRVCFIDGDGNDIPDLYDEFGISTGGSGFNGNVDYASKIKYTSNISGSASPYGYIIGGSFDQFNGNALAYSPINAIVVSNKKGGGYEQNNVFPYGVPDNVQVIRLANKQNGTCSFSYGATILPSIPWTDCSQYYINQGSIIYALDFTPLPITALQVSGGMGMPTIYDLDTNYDGSVLFCAGVFTSVQDTSGINPSISLCRVDVPVFGITDVNNNWSITNPLNQNPPFDPMSTICYKIFVSETDVKLGGNIPNSICNNFLIFNYDATVNNSLLTPYVGAFNYGAVRTFTNNFFYIPGYNPLKLDPASPNTYMTTMYGCYDDSLASLVIQGYTKTAGLSAGVSFDIDSSGQVKYTSSNITGGTNFTMKYKLTTV